MHKVFHKLHQDQAAIDPAFKRKLLHTLTTAETTMVKPKKHLTFKELFHQQQFLRSSGLAAVAIVLVSGFAVNAQQQSNQRQSFIEDNLAVPQQLDGVLAIDEIRAIAEKDKPAGASIVKVELENEHGTILYKVKFSDGSFRLYDAKTGSAFDASVNVEQDGSVPAGFVANVTLQQARDIAAGQRPGKTITKIELETEDGKVVYSVRFSDDGRVDVDATNGNVIRVKQGGSRTSESGSGSSNDGSDDNESDSGSSSSSNDDSDDSGDDSNDDGSQSDSDDDSEDDNSDSNSGSGSGHED